VTAPPRRLTPFDIEAHRGGRALRPENTLPAFANALSMGVDTLELDMGVTRDGIVVVAHERGLNPDITRAADGRYIDAAIPFVKLTLAELKQYDVGQIRPGSAYAARFPDQRAIPSTRVPALAEVFALVRRSGDRHVRLNIETKIDPAHPEESLDPRGFVTAVLTLLRQEQFSDRVLIQSFAFTLDCGLRPARPRRHGAPGHPGRGRQDLVAVLRRCGCALAGGGAPTRAAGHRLDGEPSR